MRRREKEKEMFEPWSRSRLVTVVRQRTSVPVCGCINTKMPLKVMKIPSNQRFSKDIFTAFYNNLPLGVCMFSLKCVCVGFLQLLPTQSTNILHV